MFVIPGDRLPPGFAERIDSPPQPPATPRPAATVVLARDAEAGMEVLLLRRGRSAGFVPGAYVFPGGRVDDADADPGLIRIAVGIDTASGPAPSFWMAALRELFEETGVLLVARRDGRPGGGVVEGALSGWREDLMNRATSLAELLRGAGLRPDLRHVVHIAHWITPVAEPRRYDAHFFLARLPEGAAVRPDPREMTDSTWLRPADALARFHEGDLPMVFPTVRTLESLSAFHTVAAALDALRNRAAPTVLPRLVRTEDGVAIVVDESAP